jgi:hypothetical protein
MLKRSSNIDTTVSSAQVLKMLIQDISSEPCHLTTVIIITITITSSIYNNSSSNNKSIFIKISIIILSILARFRV